jgi:hypothetical protein
VYDLQFRLRCSHCNARAGFRITIFDTRTRGDNWKLRLERVVGGSEGEMATQSKGSWFFLYLPLREAGSAPDAALL